MPKMHQNTFGGRAPAGHAGELKRSPDLLAPVKGVLLLRGGSEVKGREEGGEGKGERRGRERREEREGREVAP